MMGAVIDRLQLPAEHVWLTDDDAAVYTGFSTGHFQQSVMCKPGFPRPRVINGRRRWNCAELSAWINEQGMEDGPKVGRPRKKTG